MGKGERYHHGDLRRALVAAALALMTETGETEPSLREVARRAGVSSGAPFHHFPNKESLLAAIATEGFEGLESAIASTATAPAAAERLAERLSTYMAFATDHPAHYRVMFSPRLAGDAPVPEAQEAAMAAFGHLVAAIGEVRGPEPPAATVIAAVAAWSLAHGFVTLWQAGLIPALTGASSADAVFRAIAAYGAAMVAHGRPDS